MYLENNKKCVIITQQHSRQLSRLKIILRALTFILAREKSYDVSLQRPDWLILTRENSKPSMNQSEKLHGSLVSCVIKMSFSGEMTDFSSTTEEINEPNKMSFYPGHENKNFPAADIFVL